jgi:hypothetical protein
VIGIGDREHPQVQRDRAGDERFVKAALPLLDAEARERAELVRLRPGDPIRTLLEA